MRKEQRGTNGWKTYGWLGGDWITGMFRVLWKDGRPMENEYWGNGWRSHPSLLIGSLLPGGEPVVELTKADEGKFKKKHPAKG